ncbi:hypothetical protein D9M70_606040 [compost metagenome]
MHRRGGRGTGHTVQGAEHSLPGSTHLWRRSVGEFPDLGSLHVLERADNARCFDRRRGGPGEFGQSCHPLTGRLGQGTGQYRCGLPL